MKILIVDDSKAMRLIIRRTLRKAELDNHDFAEASNACQALEMIEAEQPDLIMVDWNMPEMTGIEMIQELKNRGISVNTGFITSEGTNDFRQQAIEAGAKFFITKPFTVETIKTQLSSLLG